MEIRRATSEAENARRVVAHRRIRVGVFIYCLLPPEADEVADKGGADPTLMVIKIGLSRRFKFELVHT